MRDTRTAISALFGASMTRENGARDNTSLRSKAISFGMPLFLGLAALHLLWLVFDWGGETHRVLLGNLLFLAPWPVATLVALCAALEHQGRARRGWLFIALGFFVQVIGNGLWSYFEVVAKTEPFPSAADFFYLVYGPLWAVGLFHLMSPPRDRLEGSRLALDVAITVGAVGLFFWRFLLAPPLSWGMNVLETGLTLAYPTIDLLLLALLLLIFMRAGSGGRPRRDLMLMDLAFALQVSGDIWYNAAMATESYQIGHPMDGVWMLSAASLRLHGRKHRLGEEKRCPQVHCQNPAQSRT